MAEFTGKFLGVIEVAAEVGGRGEGDTNESLFMSMTPKAGEEGERTQGPVCREPDTPLGLDVALIKAMSPTIKH